MRPRKYNYAIGSIIGDLKIIDIIPSEPRSGKAVKFKTKCLKCGREKLMLGATLASKRGTTHKACGKGFKLKNKKFYLHWQNMRTRTTNPNYEHYACYGGRGINSDSFKYFIDFYDQMYASYIDACNIFDEKTLSLERIDVNKDYCKENCTWIPLEDQKSNLRDTVYFEITFPDGKTEIHKNPSKFAKEHNLNKSSLQDLLNGRLKTYKNFKGHRISKESVTTKFE